MTVEEKSKTAVILRVVPTSHSFTYIYVTNFAIFFMI